MGLEFPLTSLRESSWHSFVLIHSFRCVWKGTAGCVGTSYWWPASRRSPSLLGVTALRLHVKPQVCLCCITLHDVTQERHAIVADTFWTPGPRRWKWAWVQSQMGKDEVFQLSDFCLDEQRSAMPRVALRDPFFSFVSKENTHYSCNWCASNYLFYWWL